MLPLTVYIERLMPTTTDRIPAALFVAALLTGAACSGPASPPGGRSAGQAAPDEAALREEYTRMQNQAMEDVRAWKGPGNGTDPRLAWAEKLESFAAGHPGSATAGEAMMGALVLRAARGDRKGFFAAWDQAVESFPDAPGLAEIFPQVVAMRWAEAGGPGIMGNPDRDVRRDAWRKALPHIEADLKRALEATHASATQAAAHYALGMAFYQMESDPARAQDHFSRVAMEHPESPQAESARTYVRELETLAVGQPAPDFEVTLTDGRTTRLSDHRGQVVLVDFWATWCQPCLDELPGLKNAYDRFRRRGFTVVGISLDQDAAPVKQFMQLHRIRWPVAASGLGLSDPIVQTWSVQGIPMSYLVDRKGIIRARALFGADVERVVGELLGS